MGYHTVENYSSEYCTVLKNQAITELDNLRSDIIKQINYMELINCKQYEVMVSSVNSIIQIIDAEISYLEQMVFE